MVGNLWHVIYGIYGIWYTWYRVYGVYGIEYMVYLVYGIQRCGSDHVSYGLKDIASMRPLLSIGGPFSGGLFNSSTSIWGSILGLLNF